MRDGPWRFFQYHYTLRVIDEDAFGEDLEIPELEIKYHIERSLDGGSALPGRELTYVLPAEAIRVLSLVPADASDIRGLQSETFGDADTRLFRANLAVLVAAAVGAVAFGVLLMAAIRARQHWWGAAPKGEKRLSGSVVVRRVLAELHAVQRTSQEEGWNAGLVGRALTAFRLAGAAALDTPIAQERVEPRRADREGQLAVNHGLGTERDEVIALKILADVQQRAQVFQREEVFTDVYWMLLAGAAGFVCLGTVLVKERTQLWWQLGIAVAMLALLL